MDIVTLMDLFADPAALKELTLTQKLMASLVTTLLGMGITFISLGILQVVIGLLAKAAAPRKVSAPAPSPGQQTADPGEEDRGQQELVAAITVALAIQLDTSPGNIVIRNIVKKDDNSPAWNRVGLIELMNHNA